MRPETFLIHGDVFLCTKDANGFMPEQGFLRLSLIPFQGNATGLHLIPVHLSGRYALIS